jgi:hypothetical protein
MNTVGFYGMMDGLLDKNWRRPMKAAVFTAALTLLVASSAAAQAGEGRWSLTVGAGVVPTASGIYHEGGSGTVLGLPTQVAERGWSDIYNNGFGLKLGVGYAVAERVDVTTTFGTRRQDARELAVGTVAGLELRSQFSEYRDWGLEGGLRFHLVSRDAPVNAYLGLAGGFRRIDAKPATFSVPAAGVVLERCSVLPGRRPSAPSAVTSAVQFAVAPRIRLGIEAGLRYTGRATLSRYRRPLWHGTRKPERLEQPLDGSGARHRLLPLLTSPARVPDGPGALPGTVGSHGGTARDTPTGGAPRTRVSEPCPGAGGPL